MSLEDKTLTFSNLHTYPKLSKYVGLCGKLSCRADTTYIGVEVEMENVNLNYPPPPTFNGKVDGSLKNNGIEFITIPIQFKFLEVELARLFKCFVNYTFSSRCSIHIHMNARDFTVEELKTFLLLYMIFERSLYRFSGDRWNNIFCVPLGFFTLPVTEVIIYSSTDQIIQKWYKYFGLNISPLFGGESTKIGTIEFRHMVGTDNIPWIIQWINLIVSLKIGAKKHSYKSMVEKLQMMNTDSSYYELSDIIFREYSELIRMQPTFKQDVERCITIAKSVFSTDKSNKCSIEIPFIIPEKKVILTKKGKK